jgi:hypothetical protein
MKKCLLILLASTGILVGCNSGGSSSSSPASSGNTYGPYTTNGNPATIVSVSLRDGTASCNTDDTSCTITGNASLGIGLAFNSVSPQAYFSLSPASASGITITPSGANCGTNPSAAPACTYTFSCTATGVTAEFLYQLNGPAGAATINNSNKPLTIICN